MSEVTSKSNTWLQRLEEQKSRGLSDTELAAQYGVTRHTVVYWRDRLRLRQPRRRRGPRPTVVSFNGFDPDARSVSMNRSSGDHLELEAGSIRLRFSADLSDERLRKILGVVLERP